MAAAGGDVQVPGLKVRQCLVIVGKVAFGDVRKRVAVMGVDEGTAWHRWHRFNPTIQKSGPPICRSHPLESGAVEQRSDVVLGDITFHLCV